MIQARAARPRIGSARESFLSNASAGLLDKARKALETQRNGSSSTVMSESGIISDEEDEEDDIQMEIENNEELKCLESSVIKRKEEIADIRLVLESIVKLFLRL